MQSVIFCFRFLQAAFGSGASMTAEHTAIFFAPAFSTSSMFSALIPPIATEAMPVSVRIRFACFMYSRPTAGAEGFVTVLNIGPRAT